MKVQIFSLFLTIASCCGAAINETTIKRTDTIGKSLKDKVKIHYFSKKFDQMLDLNATNLATVDFDPKKRTVIFAHGWLEDTIRPEHSCGRLKKPLLDHQDVNFLCVDWSFMTQDYFYPKVVKNLPTLAPFLGEFVDELMTHYGLDDDNVILVGFSLGAHLAGYTGEASKHKLNIIGLDPAGPGFEGLIPITKPMNPVQGKFVQVIHTDAFFLGIYVTAGTADYYVNGGLFQPKCVCDNVCSHLVAVDAFAETIKGKTLVGTSCDSYLDLTFAHCPSGSSDSHMGTLDIDTKAGGIYYVIDL